MGVGGRADGRVGRPVGEEKQKALVTVSRVVVMIVIIIAFFYFLIVKIKQNTEKFNLTYAVTSSRNYYI